MEIEWNVITSQVITAVLKVIIPVAVALVLKWAGELWLKIKGENPELADVLSYAAELAVEASEQIFGAGQGEQKKQYAIKAIQNVLAEYGLVIDVEVIADAIEREVYEMNRTKALYQPKEDRK